MMSNLNKFIRRATGNCRHALRPFVLTASLCFGLSALHAQTLKMHDYDNGLDNRSIIAKIGTNHEYKTDEIDHSVANLGKRGTDEIYFSGMPDASWGNEGAYIEVDIKDGGLDFNPANEDCLLIYVRRNKNEGHANPADDHVNAHPTAFKVVGQFEGDEEWHELFYTYLLYRGPETQEFSSKVLINKLWMNMQNHGNDDLSSLTPEVSTDKKLKKMRFYVTANNNRERGNVRGDDGRYFRDMSLARFDVLKVDKYADYSDTFKDRLHLKSDYIKDYKDYQFVNTQGIADPRNNIWNDWNLYTDEEKNTIKNLTDIDLPEFSFIEGGKDTDPPLNEGQQRQRTHTVEHIVYAIPGDVVALYPYYQMYKTKEYDVHFSHWYDYSTGGRLTFTAPWSGIKYEMLDFAIDPTNILYSEDYGYFGNEYLNKRRLIVSNVDEYIEAVQLINNSLQGAYIELTADLNFAGRTDIPMLGDSQENAFHGFLNGNGHTISNLVYDKPDKEGVGLIGWTQSGARITNLKIDNTCSFTGYEKVGLIGAHIDGAFTVSNVKTEATLKGVKADGEQTVAGIVGKCIGNSNVITLTDSYIGGTIGDSEGGRANAAISGWIGIANESAKINLSNIAINCKLKGISDGNPYFRSQQEATKISVDEKCYGNQGEVQGFKNYTNGVLWADNTPPVLDIPEAEKDITEGDRYVGNFATFFCPRNPYVNAGNQEGLPFSGNAEEEFVIAADFSQEFTLDRNVDKENGIIYEPIISSRHIFKIRDGKAFADDFSGSVENNQNFVRKNQKMVSARAGVPFQIRFDTPVPKNTDSRSNYYYKLADDDYRRVCTMDIEVYDAQSGDKLTGIDFKKAEAFVSQGSRKIDGIEYKLCGGGAEYYRMLEIENPPAGSYIVRLIGKDVNGNRIKIIESDTDLVVMEYHITFLPEAGASMLTEKELYENDKYASARQEKLEDLYGTPGVVNFDEYMKINLLGDGDNTLKDKLIYTEGPNTMGQIHSYFKWPVPWENSSYSFGYGARHDYNMYMLTTHSSLTPFNTEAERFDNNLPESGKGLYDRKYYDSVRNYREDLKNADLAEEDRTKIEQGYYYYVNAATDPGVAARLRIDDVCPGSTLHVSAWIAELNETIHPETANLSFNFVAVLKDDLGLSSDNDENNPDGTRKVVQDGIKGGDRIVIHSFITGYVPDNQRGEWLHVYYSFVPRLSEFAEHGITNNMVDHYELELDNNCKSSNGADYGVDDIRLYIANPELKAIQLTPMCGGAANIRVESPFNTLLQTCGEQEVVGENDGEEITILYTFIDKEEYNKIYDADKDNYQDAFEASVVRFDYDGRGNTDRSLYGRLTFNTNLIKNKVYGEDNGQDDNSKASYRRDETDGRDMIVFTSNLTDDVFKIKNTYYVIISIPENRDAQISEEEAHEVFDLTYKCANFGEVEVTASDVIKIDGVIVEDNSSFVICENQSPVVQVNVWGQTTTGNEGEEERVEIKKNAWFDWYLGPIEDFTKDGEDGKPSLYESLSEFRKLNPDARDFDNVKTSENLTDEMIDILKKETRLRLYESSYVVPPVTLTDNTPQEIKLVAIPLPTEPVEDMLLCTEPTEIVFTVANKSPKLQHGLAIKYPEDMDDVPLRIGLDQLRSTVKEGDNVGFKMKRVEIPVRNASSTDGKVQTLSLITESAWDGKEVKPGQTGCIVLVETDDKEYEDLGTIGLDKDNNKEYDTDHLLWVGEVNKLTASTAEGAQENLFDVEFDKNFNFKEGYYYRMRFQYSESKESSEEDENEEVVCNGHDVFTLKIVPKYLQWTGTKDNSNLNWNNDANWKRVTASDLYAEEKNGDPDYRHHVTDGKDGNSDVNGREKSFAPLDFTYVIIPAEPEAPYLYSAATDKVTVQRTGVTDTYDWSEDPKENNNGYGDYPEAGVGDHTNRIHYDMAACDLTDYADAATGCRPWYMNTCNEIHFLPGASIMNQQELVYNKAWVDVELDPQRWYTLASPLQEVYAGDFYLPSESGRQETELFNDIEFDTDKNNRFKPAVYQRGWDKSTARVYEIGGPGVDDSGVRNVMVKANWSNVYNDVKELYGGGTGFSIKADVSAMESQPENDKVLFRLPKADTSFDYFNLDGTTSGHNTPISRSAEAYRLNDLTKKITATTAQEGQYFLVGNPFMTYMDIRKFIESNPDLEQVFWIVTANGQIAGTIGDTGVVTTEPAEEGQDLTVMAPMQGFFVKSKEKATEVNLSYDKTMMRRNGTDKPMLKAPAMSDEETAMLRITAVNDGETTSSAVLATGYGDSGMNNVEAIDNRSLGIPSTVYTIGGGQALSINFADTAEGTEIGVAADSDAMTTLRFEVPETMEDLSLLDKADYSLTPLYDGMEISVEGAAAGRFFLTHGNNVEEVYGGLEWAVDNSGLTVCDQASTGRLSVKVYDTVGRRIASEATGADSIRIDLAQGVYVVEITNGNETKSIKIRI